MPPRGSYATEIFFLIEVWTRTIVASEVDACEWAVGLVFMQDFIELSVDTSSASVKTVVVSPAGRGTSFLAGDGDGAEGTPAGGRYPGH